MIDKTEYNKPAENDPYVHPNTRTEVLYFGTRQKDAKGKQNMVAAKKIKLYYLSVNLLNQCF